ncbi:hypothetical protein [Paraburkholderia youngii]|uniref:Uncharacterized protein n=1 Tax=Paraburkholderia youngii TaxID=2782701 RepID=A0ABX2NST4_9BURK|nr:hypothetical protein [Paraburkholderia youngii]NVI07523.1 hypothetical protein [Paraburkholderia youngii]
MHGVRNMACAERPAKGDYAALVQIAHEGKFYVDWHLPQCHQRWASREQAEAQALGYAVRLLERRPFHGPSPDFPEAA